MTRFGEYNLYVSAIDEKAVMRVVIKKTVKNLRNQMVSHTFVVIYATKMEARRDVFQAIADPTRREIIFLIANRSLSLNAVAENFQISRPAISKHIKILTECGLIDIRQQGRERYCEARLDKLNEISAWVEQYRKFWTEKLDVLEVYLEELQGKDKSKKTVRTKTKKHVNRKAKN
jgi:DNA-binding transcriptional ArsR family regulator